MAFSNYTFELEIFSSDNVSLNVFEVDSIGPSWSFENLELEEYVQKMWDVVKLILLGNPELQSKIPKYSRIEIKLLSEEKVVSN